MTVLTVSDFRTYFLDRVFTDVVNKKITYQEAVRLTNEAGVFFSSRNEAQTVLNAVSSNTQVQPSQANTYGDLIPFNRQTASNSPITKEYDSESSSAIRRLMVDPINNRIEVTYRGNNRTYGYIPASSANMISIYNSVKNGLNSPGTSVHTWRSERSILPE